MTIDRLVLPTAVLLALVVVPASCSAQQREVLSDGAVIHGTLRIVRTKHPNGTPIRAFRLVSATGYFLNDDEFCEKDLALKKFQLVTKDRDTAKRLEGSVGQTLHNIAVDRQGNIFTAEVNTGQRAQKFRRLDMQN